MRVGACGRSGSRGGWQLACVLVLLAGCYAVPPPPRPPVEPPPSPVAENTPTPERWIVVKKNARTLSLYQGSEVVRVYAVVLGKDPVGPKLYEGDRRTPEGQYHISKKYYHPYWERFMMLDYPTQENREVYARNRQRGLIPVRERGFAGIGGAIGIHGTEIESLNRRGVDWTAGCVSLLNHDIEELYELVPVGTLVIIEP